MSSKAAKITIEPFGRNKDVPWTGDPSKPIPMLYRVVGLSNCMTPQINTRLTDSEVADLIGCPYTTVVIRQAKVTR